MTQTNNPVLEDMYAFVHLAMVMRILYLAESRVYCQDSNASPWKPLGYTCPIVCQNIIDAIERLKIIDFEGIIYKNPQKQTTRTNKNVPLLAKDKKLSNEIDDFDDVTEKFIHRTMNAVTDYRKTNHSTDDKEFHKDVIKLAQRATKTFNGRCTGQKSDGLLAKLKKCARKSNYDGSFLNIMTNMLNKYVNSKYLFTEDMTEALLEKILGKNTDLRNSIFDVNKLLKYLRQAIHMHKEHENQDVISLKPKHCLTISLPGCFCRPGFVESSGQCVKPSDCVDETLNAAYLSRVIVY